MALPQAPCQLGHQLPKTHLAQRGRQPHTAETALVQIAPTIVASTTGKHTRMITTKNTCRGFGSIKLQRLRGPHSATVTTIHIGNLEHLPWNLTLSHLVILPASAFANPWPTLPTYAILLVFFSLACPKQMSNVYSWDKCLNKCGTIPTQGFACRCWKTKNWTHVQQSSTPNPTSQCMFIRHHSLGTSFLTKTCL